MTLPAPILDDRTFDQLVSEARTRIPRFTPEWTNFNDSDPGMTLVKLHAWMTETILYRLNKLPDLTYIKFLELLNVEPRPAVAAQAQLTFKLKKLSEPQDVLSLLIAKNTQVAVDDPDLTTEVIFETDRTLTALNALLATVIAPVLPDDLQKPELDVVTQYDADKVEVKTPLPFYPFGKEPLVDSVCLLGILLRPNRKKGVDYSQDRFPAGELDLTAFVPEVFEKDANRQVIQGPNALDCLFPWQVTSQSETIVWEAYSGIEPATDFEDPDMWQQLSLLDETAALTRSGHLYLDVPGGLPVVSFAQLNRSLWSKLGLKKAPTNTDELIADLTSDVFDPKRIDKKEWEKLGLSGSDLETFCALINDPATTDAALTSFIQNNANKLNFSAIAESVWTDEKIGYDRPPVPFALTWFRARLLVKPEAPLQISQFLINTVAATAAVTRSEEVLGTSDGRPNQSFKLRRSPVLVLPDSSSGKLVPQLELVVREVDEPEVWMRVDDFFGVGPDQAVFRLDVANGTVTFGDGQHGRIPVANAEIKALRYRVGGTQVANVGIGTIKRLKSALASVDSVTNVRAATGGADAEPLNDVILRAPHDLRMRDRAVTQQDFAELALQTPGVRIQRAYAVPLMRATTTEDPTTQKKIVTRERNQPGAVTVVILPENKQATPQPSEDQLRLVCAHLNRRRLITTELYVVGPRYFELSALDAEVLVSRKMDLKAVGDALRQRLLTFFHPLRGGEDGRGWPFGQPIYFAQVYRQLLNVSGVTRLLCLAITPKDVDDSEECADIVTIGESDLVYLPESAINLKVSYDPIG